MSRQPVIAHEFEAGNRWIRATINLFRGRVYLDLRQWYEPEPGAELRPSPKGISVPADYLDELEATVAAFKKTLASGGRR
jgi:hypothetical protein